MKLGISLGLCLLLSGCVWLKKAKHVKSSLVGLSRKVELLSCSDGKVLREWKGNFTIEMSGGIASWIDNEDHEVKIAGCFVIEEQ